MTRQKLERKPNKKQNRGREREKQIMAVGGAFLRDFLAPVQYFFEYKKFGLGLGGMLYLTPREKVSFGAGSSFRSLKSFESVDVVESASCLIIIS